jgi:hypothetical protein
MLEFATAHQIGQQVTRDLAHSALPGAPVIPLTVQPVRRRVRRRVRRGAALMLYRLADRLQPA